MSYTRSFSKTIAVHYSGTISYPASEHGGTKSYSGVEYENVTIDITVDTDAFDRNIRRCEDTVDGLTTSVVATEAAQIASIRQNAEKVGGTIVKGFFNTVRSEMSQQIMELTTKVDTTLVHLNKLAQSCKNKQQQMQNDYGRITSRYLKIFNDLDNELENRIFELCRPAFLFKRHADDSVLQAMNGDMATTATVSNTEQSVLEAKIAASLAKRRALATINQANDFLSIQKRTEYILNNSTIDDIHSGFIYMPVCYIETNAEGIINRQAFTPSILKSVNNQKLIDSIANKELQNELTGESKMLEESFHREVSSSLKNDDEHSKRVMEYINKLYYSNIK